MQADELRTQAERELEARLLTLPEVQEAVASAERVRLPSTRRHLLGTSLRLTEQMAPGVAEALAHCRQVLGVQTPTELFVYPDAAFNAACFRPEGGRVFVMLSSALLESFDPGELKFVMGHELGHHLFDHHKIPLGALTSGNKPLAPGDALQLYSWHRYAEISADRAGLVCAGDLEAAARAFFKLSSGLHGQGVKGTLVRMSSQDLLAQVGDIREELARQPKLDAPMQSDWFATHPFSPLRLRAAEAFHESALFASFVPSGRGVKSRELLEAELHDLMSLMEPGYLQEKSEAAEALRRFLLAGGIAVAMAAGEVEKSELEALETLLGAGSAAGLRFDLIRADLGKRANDVKERVPPIRRAQVIRDLCVIALADGHGHSAEQLVLEELAVSIDVDPGLVGRTLGAAAKPLD